MRKQFNARAITLYDKKEDMVIGTLMLYKATEPIPWLPSNGTFCYSMGTDTALIPDIPSS